MQKMVIASYNPAKVNEFKLFMADWPFEIISLNDAKVIENIEETGITFQENALIKAKLIQKVTELPTLADDGGMEIDALSGEPGVHSRRWKGYEMTDQEMVDYTLERLNGVPREKRTARLKLVLCCIMPGQEPIFSDGAIEGIITEKQETALIVGYPFRSIMFIPQFNKMFSELSETEHRSLNQRVLALNKLRVQLGI